jgi:hypothetical protein
MVLTEAFDPLSSVARCEPRRPRDPPFFTRDFCRIGGIVEPDMSLVTSLCERVPVLNFGQKIAEKTAFEVQHNPEVLKAYLGETLGAEQP